MRVDPVAMFEAIQQELDRRGPSEELADSVIDAKCEWACDGNMPWFDDPVKSEIADRFEQLHEEILDAAHGVTRVTMTLHEWESRRLEVGRIVEGKLWVYCDIIEDHVTAKYKKPDFH
jgi:hypothetical protein